MERFFEKEVQKKVYANNITIKNHLFYFTNAMKIAKILTAGQNIGLFYSHTINDMNKLLSLHPYDFESTEKKDQLSLFFLILYCVKEANHNLDTHYTLDEITFVQFNELVNTYLHADNPIDKILYDLDKSAKYGLSIENIEKLKVPIGNFVIFSFSKLDFSTQISICEKIVKKIVEAENDGMASKHLENLENLTDANRPLKQKIALFSKNFIENFRGSTFVMNLLKDLSKIH